MLALLGPQPHSLEEGTYVDMGIDRSSSQFQTGASHCLRDTPVEAHVSPRFTTAHMELVPPL